MIIRFAAIVLLSASLLELAYAGPRPGGGPHGGGPHLGGAPHLGGGPRLGGGPHIGGGGHAARIAIPHGGPRGIGHAVPHGFAARSFSRAHVAPRARFAARPAFRGRAGSHVATRALNRSALNRRALNRSVARSLISSNRAPGGARSNTLRSAPVRAQPNARNTSAFALRAFRGTTARAQAARLFGDPALARHRFDPAFFARVRFAGAFWPGPFFWPYAYYDEAFWLWPSAYDDVFWGYGYDDILRGTYSPYAFSDYDEFLEGIGRPVRRARGPAPPRSFGELCGQAAPGLTDWPVDQIVNVVAPNVEQRALLDALIRASDKAAEVLRAACPRSVAVTPIGRLDALEQQFAALEEAVRIVRPALEKFYGSLNDDQKERFNALGPTARPGRFGDRSCPKIALDLTRKSPLRASVE